MAAHVICTGHSWNHIACTPKAGHLINLSKLNRILSLDADSHLVTIEAGVTINQLNAYLHAHGLAVHNLGHIGYQTFSGAISTGTHGSGFKFGVLASHVTRFSIVDGSGSVIEASETDNSDIYHAGLLGLGALGIITDITLHVRPAFNIKQYSRVETIENILATFDVDSQSSDYYQVRCCRCQHDACMSVMCVAVLVDSVNQSCQAVPAQHHRGGTNRV